jgi:uncharacterized protein HemX
MLARAALDQVDTLIRKRFGSGLPDEIKTIAADTVRKRVDEWLAASREDEPQNKPQSASKPTTVQPPENGHVARSAFVLAIAAAIAIVIAIVVGSLVAMQLTNRLMHLDRSQTERITGMEARLAEAENLQLELRANAAAQDVAEKKNIEDHERRLKQVETRQDALVIYLLSSVGKLLEERKIRPPAVPPVLQIAQAEIMLSTAP